MATHRSRLVLFFAGLLAAICATADIARGETYRPGHTLLNPGPAPGGFGVAVALAGSEALASAPGPFFFSTPVVGTVHVFDVASGGLLRSLSDPTSTGGSSFGAAIATIGANVLIGAPDASGGGAAYLFDRASGALLHTFTNPTPSVFQFGGYVGTLDSDIVIGHRSFNGGAEIYDGTTWAHVRTLAGQFEILATKGSDLVVSPSPGHAELRDGTTGAVVRAYVDPVAGGNFGGAAAVVGTTIIVGDPAEDGIEIAEGAVYAFDSASGALLYTLHPPDTYETFSFGAPMTVAGTTLFVTAGRGGEDGKGEVIMYDGTSGTLLGELYPPHPAKLGSLSTANAFGAALAADGERVLIGTPFDSRNAPTFGAAHLYDRCGNGTQVAGEECDDGNTTDGDGCSSECRLEVCGTAPHSGCHAAAHAGLTLFDPYVVYNIRAKLRWTWSGTGAEFGDPLTTAGQVLCIYSASPPAIQVAALPGGTCDGHPCWSSTTTSFRYKGPEDGLPDSALEVRLKPGGGTSQLRFIGYGENLGVPDRQCPECGIPYTGTVTAQLVNTETGACWSSTFPTTRYKNRKGKLTGKVP
jgi:cysteine-rich repeat protein